MGERINEILKKLKPKEKIAIIVSMSALALILIGLVLLLAFCGADKHKHSYTCTLEMVDGKFTYTRSCTTKDCDQPYYEEKDVKATVESVIEATCGKKGEIVYVYSYQGSEAKYVEYTPVTGKHTLNGKPIEENLNEDGSINFGIPGVGLASGESTDRPCGTVVKGHYQCDGCAQLAVIDVAFGHRSEDKVIKAATCLAPGSQQAVCRDCGDELADPTEIAPLGHKYAFTLKQTNLVGECTRPDCTENFQADVSTLEVVATTKATCAKPATTTYKVKTNNGQTVEATVDIPSVLAEHTLNGVDYTTLANEDGTFSHTVPGIQFHDGHSMCDTPSDEFNASFECEVCGERVRVRIPTKGHSVVLDKSTLDEPDFTSEGYIYSKCINDNCDYEKKIVLPLVEIGENAEILSQNIANNSVTVKYTHIGDLGQTVELTITISNDHEHNYTYSLNEDKTVLTGVCTVSGCLNPNYLAEVTNVTETGNVIPATCASGKIVEYICTANGKQVTFTVVEGESTTDHILGGVVAEGTVIVRVEGQTVKAYEYGTEGIKLFSGQEIKSGEPNGGYFKCEACGEVVQVYVFVPADYQP